MVRGVDPVDRLREELNLIFNDPNFSQANWGVAIQSLTNGQYIYLKDADKNFMPASNMKLFTTAAALVKLSPEFTYCTSLYRTGEISPDGVLKGDVVVRGSGDPTIGGRYCGGEITRILEDWADSLKALGVRIIHGNIVGDDNYFADEIMGAGWAWDYQSNWYAAQISALSFNENCVDIIFTPGDSVGAPANFRIEPNTQYVIVRSHVITSKRRQKTELTYHRRRATNIVEINGSIPIDMEEVRDWFSVENPTLYAVTVFWEVLKGKGIEVKGKPLDIDSLSAYKYIASERTRIASYTSPPLSEIVKTTNKVSQNLYAELLLRTLGAEFKGVGDAEHGIKVVKEFLAEVGIAPHRIQIADGSGLSRLNLVTPRQVITLLRYMRRHKYGEYFYDSLPIAGIDGTLRFRMKGTAAEGNVRAKTGYVNRVRALSGYVTSREGEEFVFSMITNNYLVPTTLANNIQDLVCERLAYFSRHP